MKKALSILLAIVMAITCIPQTALYASASEPETIVTNIEQTDVQSTENPQTGSSADNSKEDADESAQAQILADNETFANPGESSSETIALSGESEDAKEPKQEQTSSETTAPSDETQQTKASQPEQMADENETDEASSVLTDESEAEDEQEELKAGTVTVNFVDKVTDGKNNYLVDDLRKVEGGFTYIGTMGTITGSSWDVNRGEPVYFYVYSEDLLGAKEVKINGKAAKPVGQTGRKGDIYNVYELTAKDTAENVTVSVTLVEKCRVILGSPFASYDLYIVTEKSGESGKWEATEKVDRRYGDYLHALDTDLKFAVVMKPMYRLKGVTSSASVSTPVSVPVSESLNQTVSILTDEGKYEDITGIAVYTISGDKFRAEDIPAAKIPHVYIDTELDTTKANKLVWSGTGSFKVEFFDKGEVSNPYYTALPSLAAAIYVTPTDPNHVVRSIFKNGELVQLSGYNEATKTVYCEFETPAGGTQAVCEYVINVGPAPKADEAAVDFFTTDPSLDKSYKAYRLKQRGTDAQTYDKWDVVEELSAMDDIPVGPDFHFTIVPNEGYYYDYSDNPVRPSGYTFGYQVFFEDDQTPKNLPVYTVTNEGVSHDDRIFITLAMMKTEGAKKIEFKLSEENKDLSFFAERVKIPSNGGSKSYIGLCENKFYTKDDSIVMNISSPWQHRIKSVTLDGQPMTLTPGLRDDEKEFTCQLDKGIRDYTFIIETEKTGTTPTPPPSVKKQTVKFNLAGVSATVTKSGDSANLLAGGVSSLTVDKDTQLTIKATADSGKNIKTAKYKIGTRETVLTAEQIASLATTGFTIKVTDNAAVDLIAIAPKQHKVAFAGRSSSAVWFSDVTVKGTVKSKAELAAAGNKITVNEGDITGSGNNTITFKVTGADKGYKTPQVTLMMGGAVKELNADNSGVYKLDAVTADAVITITDIRLDPDKCNKIKISPAKDTSPNAYTAKIMIVSAGFGVSLKSNDTCLMPTDAAVVNLIIKANGGYDNVAVKDSGADLTAESDAADIGGAKTYKITFADKKAYALEISASEKTAGSDVEVLFANKAEHMSYAVTNGEIAAKASGRNNTYKIVKGDGRNFIEFTVTPQSASYEPAVTVDGAAVSYTKGGTAKKPVYAYKILAAQIEDAADKTITIDEAAVKHTITLIQTDKDAAEITASVGGLAISPDEDPENTAETVNTDGLNTDESVKTVKYTVAEGASISFTAALKDGYKWTEYSIKSGTAAPKSVKALTAGIANVKDDCTVYANTAAVYTVKVEKAASGETGEVAQNKDKTYTVNYGVRKYKVTLFHAGAKEDITDAAFKKAGSSEVNSAAVISGGAAEITLDSNDIANAKAAKKMELLLTAGGHTETVALSFAPIAGKITKVGKIGIKSDKKADLTQTVNTAKTYELAIDPKTAENYNLAVSYGAGEGAITASIDKTTLTITAAMNDAGKTREIKIHDTAGGSEANPLCTITVKTALPALPAPSVALERADDTKLYLKLGAKGVDMPAADGGKVYYKVTAAPASGTVPSGKTAPVQTVKYFELDKDKSGRNYLASQTEEMQVIAGDAGEGFAYKFNVKVELIQSKKGMAISQPGDEDSNKLTVSEKSAAKNNLETKVPAYPAKITLKGANTVYTNQTVAVNAAFDANATYAQLQDDVTDTYSGAGGKLTVALGGDKKSFTVKADENTAPGKHTIKVTAAAAPGNASSAATAEYAITVVRAIEKIDLPVPPSVYKADKKAAALKIVPVFNDDLTGKDKDRQPKLKAKLEWWISTDAEGTKITDASPLYKYVTVKNGTVTVAKDYIVSGDTAQNEFYVTAKAMDVTTGATAVKQATSAKITISARSIMPGELILVSKTADGSGKYKVIARDGGTVTQAELQGAKIAVLKKGAVDRNEYTEAQLSADTISAAAFDYKAGKKDIVLTGAEVKEVQKGGLASVTITAAARDGSGKKAELKNLTVN